MKLLKRLKKSAAYDHRDAGSRVQVIPLYSLMKKARREQPEIQIENRSHVAVSEVHALDSHNLLVPAVINICNGRRTQPAFQGYLQG